MAGASPVEFIDRKLDFQGDRIREGFPENRYDASSGKTTMAKNR